MPPTLSHLPVPPRWTLLLSSFFSVQSDCAPPFLFEHSCDPARMVPVAVINTPSLPLFPSWGGGPGDLFSFGPCPLSSKNGLPPLLPLFFSSSFRCRWRSKNSPFRDPLLPPFPQKRSTSCSENFSLCRSRTCPISFFPVFYWKRRGHLPERRYEIFFPFLPPLR